MSDKQNKFIGGGFPNIKECNETKEIINKESKKKREFSINNIIPISKILINRSKSVQKNIVMSETFDVVDNILYDSVDNILHKTYSVQKKKYKKKR